MWASLSVMGASSLFLSLFLPPSLILFSHTHISGSPSHFSLLFLYVFIANKYQKSINYAAARVTVIYAGTTDGWGGSEFWINGYFLSVATARHIRLSLSQTCSATSLTLLNVLKRVSPGKINLGLDHSSDLDKVLLTPLSSLFKWHCCICVMISTMQITKSNSLKVLPQTTSLCVSLEGSWKSQHVTRTCWKRSANSSQAGVFYSLWKALLCDAFMTLL